MFFFNNIFKKINNQRKIKKYTKMLNIKKNRNNKHN